MPLVAGGFTPKPPIVCGGWGFSLRLLAFSTLTVSALLQKQETHHDPSRDYRNEKVSLVLVISFLIRYVYITSMQQRRQSYHIIIILQIKTRLAYVHSSHLA